jgi:hypothetical protein
MLDKARPRCADVTGRIDVTDPDAVTAALLDVLGAHYPLQSLSSIPQLGADFARLYRGEYPGYHACDVGYHDMQHVLDVTLAMARLMAGYQSRHHQDLPLDQELAVAGIACALFHDSGYIRRLHDSRHNSGAEYTRTHVSRSARFMSEYLPTVGMDYAVPICARMVHFTGYEVNPTDIDVPTQEERITGWLLGTADLIAQMSDVAYLEKCRDHLYAEFVGGGMAGKQGEYTETGIMYKSPAHLMQSTPNFIRSAIQVRLDGYFHSYYRYAADYFGGVNLYMDALQDNCDALESILAKNDPALLLGDSLSPPV